jgi:hypothetical protein
MNAIALSKQSKEMQGSAWCIKQHKVFRVFIRTGIPNRIPLDFRKGQGLAKGKRKGKGNARILASKEKKKFNCKIRGVTLAAVARPGGRPAATFLWRAGKHRWCSRTVRATAAHPRPGGDGGCTRRGRHRQQRRQILEERTLQRMPEARA